MSERSPIPNLPPLSGVQDPAVRAYLESLTQAWLVRNGQTRETDERFLTVKDLREGIQQVTGNGGGGNFLDGGGRGSTQSAIAGALQSLIDDVQQSRMWKLLGERLQQIEMPEWFRGRFGAEIKTEQIKEESARQSLAAEVTTVTAALGSSIAGVQTEVKAVANATNALSSQTTTAIAQTNANVALAQQRIQSVSDQAGSTASQVTTLQAGLNSTTGTANSAYYSAQQAFSLAQSANGTMNGAWSVKFDAQGYVVGAGLGIQGKNGSYSSEFMVRADRFSIGSPVDPNAMNDADVPFIVTTVPRTIGGITYPPGTWIKTAYIADATIGQAKIQDAAISSAKMQDAAVDTLKIAGEAVTVPVSAIANGIEASATIYMSHPGKIAVFVMCNWIAAQGQGASSGYLRATCDGIPGPEIGVSMNGGYSGSATAFGELYVGAGYHTVSLSQGTAISGRILGVTSVFAIGVKR